MCVIIHTPEGNSFNEADLELALDANPDGFGFMYYDEEKDCIHAEKNLDVSIGVIKKLFENYKDRDAVFHYRYKTKGEITKTQCHPFRILSKKKHGMDMYLMHNGTITGVSPDAGESDTQALVRKILRPILAKKPSLIRTEAFKELVETFIGQHSKLCIMFGKGEVIKFNEAKGATRDGCWVSNTYSFTANYRKPVNNHYNNHYNTHNSASTSLFTPVRTKGSKSPKEFLGTKFAVGDIVNVFSSKDDTFKEEGTIMAYNCNNVYIKFNVPSGTHLTKVSHYSTEKTFILETGKEAYGPHTHFATPLAIIGELFEDDTNVVAITDGTKKEEVQEDTQDVVEEDTKGVVVDEDEFLVTHHGITVDSVDNYGGMNVIDCGMMYDDVSYYDVYNMDSQDRFEFFLDKPELSFNMFQDLIDHIVIVDQEYYESLEEEIAFDYSMMPTVN